jgi:hypothetical protein
MHKPLCVTVLTIALCGCICFIHPCWNSCVLSALLCGSCVLHCAISVHAVAKPFSIAILLWLCVSIHVRLPSCFCVCFSYVTLCFVCADLTVSYTVRMLAYPEAEFMNVQLR